MAPFDTLKTADYSPLVVHFTKDKRMVREDLITDANALYPFRAARAKDRLISILKTRTIYASPMPFLPTSPQAVCFTECIWDGLNELALQYSPYAVVLSKRLVFDAGGGPALYVRGDLLAATQEAFPPPLFPFISPFDPNAVLKPGTRLDWLYEREWRLPQSLSFDFAHIEYVLVQSIKDAAEIVHEIGAQYLPEDKMIPLDVYRNIRQAWSET